MDNGPVTVASFATITEAEMCRGLLESNGIEAFLANENTVTLQYPPMSALVPVEVRVAGTDLEKTTTILREVQ